MLSWARKLLINRSDIRMICKGYISIEYTVWCGECGNWDQISGKKKYAKRQWKIDGWKLTRDYGWLCSNCSENHLKLEKL